MLEPNDFKISSHSQEMSKWRREDFAVARFKGQSDGQKKQKFQQALSREAVTLHDTFWSPEINPSSLQKKLFLRIRDSFF